MFSERFEEAKRCGCINHRLRRSHTCRMLLKSVAPIFLCSEVENAYCCDKEETGWHSNPNTKLWRILESRVYRLGQEKDFWHTRLSLKGATHRYLRREGHLRSIQGFCSGLRRSCRQFHR